MEHKFLCDATVQRLAKWLRFLGLDTTSTKEYNPHFLIEIAKKEERIILTRNKSFQKLGAYLLKSDLLFEELSEVVEAFNIKEPKILTRCFKCNCPLINIKKEDVKKKVPYFTYKNFDEFKFCQVCNKIYWRGSHIDLMIKRLQKEGIWALLF